MFNTLWFYYKVIQGDNSPDLDYVDTSSLITTCADIQQYNGELDADTTLPSPGAAGSLGANKNIVISTGGGLLQHPNMDGIGGRYFNNNLCGGMNG